MDRQIVLDTETTGLEVAQEHRIIEVGCIELKNRRPSGNNFRHFLNPDRDIDFGAVQVHGITREFLADKPRFADIAQAFVDYVRGAELLIHNADFDVGFLNAELARAGRTERIEALCRVTDTIQMARRLHPGQKNGLDALCRRYGVDNSQRDLHGAFLDASLLADVYVAMTAGQSMLTLETVADAQAEAATTLLEDTGGPLLVVQADGDEIAAHVARLQVIAKKSGRLIWNTELPPVQAAA